MERSYEGLLALALNEAAALVANKADAMDLPDDLTEWEDAMIRGLLKQEVKNLLADQARKMLRRARRQQTNFERNTPVFPLDVPSAYPKKSNKRSRRLFIAAQPKQPKKEGK